MQYLVMQNRILYLPQIAIYDIYKPMGHIKDKRLSVNANDLEKKVNCTLFKGSLEECQRFLAALASTINTADQPAVPIEAILAKMDNEDAHERVTP